MSEMSLQWLPRDQIPEEYGGDLVAKLEGDDVLYPYYDRPLEAALRKFVDGVNDKKEE